MQTFERAMNTTLDECKTIGIQRGLEYSDSWSLDNQVSVFTGAVLREAGIPFDAELMRKIQLAALSDVKLQRIASGSVKRDSFIDGINYISALADFLAPSLPKSYR